MVRQMAFDLPGKEAEHQIAAWNPSPHPLASSEAWVAAVGQDSQDLKTLAAALAMLALVDVQTYQPLQLAGAL